MGAIKKAPKCVLTIAGSDSGAGAGIQADLKTMAAQGVYGLCAITAITAQNTRSVEKVMLLPAEMVAAQIEAVAADFSIAAVKIGMLGNAEIIDTVAETLQRLVLSRIVLDPVMVAKSGDLLLEKGAQKSLRERLFPLATVLTPNIPEAEALVGEPLQDLSALKEAARLLKEMGPAYVLLKGGHLPLKGEVVDLLFDGERFYYYRGKEIITKNTHGSGCTYASAIAAHLALGKTVPLAVKAAREYLQKIFPEGLQIGGGHGPLDHFSLWGRQKKVKVEQ